MGGFIRYARLFRLYETIQPFLKYSLPVEEGLPGTAALVVAPHPDDESIGCGGTVIRHTDAGKTADIVFCTMDTERRRGEAGRAVRLLGARETVFLDHPVRSLDGDDGFVRRLAGELNGRGPEVVLVPFFLDNHADHRAVNRALVLMRRRKLLKRRDFMVYAYPVWFPLYPNVLVDTGAVTGRKNEAISCYGSQTETRDYVGMSTALTTYWAAVKGRGLKAAETFFRASFAAYTDLAAEVLGG